MSRFIQFMLMLSISIILLSCDSHQDNHDSHSHKAQEIHEESEKGPHGGRLLTDDNFSLELTIFESGVPPEFRVFAYDQGKLIEPQDVNLEIALTRLGGRVDQINFVPRDEYLHGDKVIIEPHSFVVNINAEYRGKDFQWVYENFEGRTKISADVAKQAGIATSLAGAAVIEESINVYGQIVANPDNIRKVSARFEGVIQNTYVSIGQVVKKGQTLAKIESNESLSTYSIKAPISGVITSKNANTGEQTKGKELFTIMNNSSVWASLQIFPKDLSDIKLGDEVSITTSDNSNTYSGSISNINVVANANQSVTARVVLDNADGALTPGSFVTARIHIAHHDVPLAVKRSALQQFRDFTVVYAKVGDEYEVRMLELGRQDEQWVEVLEGLESGTLYVSENSYLVKADIEKAGATHDH